jgi:SOS-response transcriptional repressor LexA
MYLKGLVHRELGEGLTEDELASVVGVSTPTVVEILADKLPDDPAIWEKFARYFSMDVDFLRTGGPVHRVFELTESPQHSREKRKVALLRWDQIDKMVTANGAPHIIEMLETDVPGQRTFAVQVKDNSMQPLFSEGEIIFVNPDLPSEPGHYVVVESKGSSPEGALLRQLKEIGGQFILHPLNRRYGDMQLTQQQRIWGRVVRLRKNL